MVMDRLMHVSFINVPNVAAEAVYYGQFTNTLDDALAFVIILGDACIRFDGKPIAIVAGKCLWRIVDVQRILSPYCQIRARAPPPQLGEPLDFGVIAAAAIPR